MKKTKTFSQKRIAIEARSRRKVAKAWKQKSESSRYHMAAAKELCEQTMTKLKGELFDGILLRLRGKNDKKVILSKSVL